MNVLKSAVLLLAVCGSVSAMASQHRSKGAVIAPVEAKDVCQPGMLTSVQHLTCAEAQASVKSRHYREGDEAVGLIFHCSDNAPIAVVQSADGCDSGYSPAIYTTPTSDDGACVIGYSCIDK